jgi:hypothetical protein
MFKITTSDTFKWPVEVRIPTDGGRHQKATFDAEFRRLPQSQLEKMAERLTQNEGDGAAVCRELVVGWEGVEDDAGPVRFSAEALGRVLDIPGVVPALIGSYFDALRGLERKN